MRLFGGEDPLVATLRTELAAAHEREKALQAQVADLVKMLSAHMDQKAHAAATREKQPAEPKLPPLQPQTRLPPYIGGLSTGGHVKLGGIRRNVAQRRNPTSVRNLPPVVRDVERG